jgi:CheY-like chemotaxis protein/HPt (histidine-containing phosphotransfer) domain-containing protein
MRIPWPVDWPSDELATSVPPKTRYRPRRARPPDVPRADVSCYNFGANCPPTGTTESPGVAVRDTILPEGSTLDRGRYEITGYLGRGGMGAVYRTVDRKTGKEVAVKLLFREPSPAVVARFQNEMQAMARVVDANVVRIFEVIEDPGPGYSMELLDGGGPLEWMARHGAMPPQLAVSIAVHVGRGLGALHRLGMVHRDVKPENIFVSVDGTPKLGDFGIVLDPENRNTREGTVLGTPAYMAPVQLLGGRSAVDAAADVYGLASSLYTFLTDRVEPDLFARIYMEPLMERVPEPLRAILIRGLDPVPESRPTIAEFVRQLMRAAHQLPSPASSQPPFPANRSRARSADAARPGTVLTRARTVLVVDDEPSTLRTATAILKNAGYRVLEADGGRTAMDAAEGWGGFLDCILMDLVMPGEGGASVAKAVQRIRPGAVVVYMSGRSREDLREMGMSLQHFLAKPFTAADLQSVVAAAVAHTAPPNLHRRRVPAMADPVTGLAPAAIANLRQIEAAGSPGFLSEVVRDFRNDSRQRIERMRAAIAANDLPRLEFESHTLKSSSSMLGATAFSELAARILSDTRRGHRCTPERIEALAAELSRVESALVKLATEITPDRPPAEEG